MPPTSSFAPKLNLHDAVNIRRAHAAGVSTNDLRHAYRLARSSLHAVLRRRAHVCSVTVQLADDIYLRLARVAEAEGTSFESVVLRLIARAVHAESRT
jgi:hypothetical protein